MMKDYSKYIVWSFVLVGLAMIFRGCAVDSYATDKNIYAAIHYSCGFILMALAVIIDASYSGSK